MLMLLVFCSNFFYYCFADENLVVSEDLEILEEKVLEEDNHISSNEELEIEDIQIERTGTEIENAEESFDLQIEEVQEETQEIDSKENLEEENVLNNRYVYDDCDICDYCYDDTDCQTFCSTSCIG